MKILCIGQSAYDVTLPVDAYPIENRKIKISKKIECGGGSANNSAYLLGLWGEDVSFASSVGNDLEGEKIEKELLQVNVNLDYFYEHQNIPTTTSYIIANTSKGTRTIITNKDPLMIHPSNYNIKKKFDLLLMDGNDYELAERVIKNNPGAIKIIDAGSLNDGTKKLCPLVDYILCSHDFARDYTKTDFVYDDLKTLSKVHDIMANDFQGKVVITLEECGCFTKIDGEYKIIPSIKVNPVDSTGAGDIYHGAFTYFLANNYPYEECLRLANVAGALSVTKIGSKASIPKLKEVLKYHEL